ncbi:MAG TPA: hypothetical protein VHX18_07900 [Rhizomicrobium sp.]|jgi:hypothetical protein|nr:hypothetical protein [Rhizomicrobium sp.]
MYVIAPEQKAQGFTDELAGMVGRFGMTAYVDHTPANGAPFHVLTSYGKWLYLWSQNMPLDADAPTEGCGPRSQIQADPGQYILMVFRVLPFGTERAAKDFSSELASALRAKGYEVRSKPLMCSPWLKDRVMR